MDSVTGRKIAGNTLIQVLSKAVTVATSVVSVALLTRYLGVAGYGAYTTIFAYAGVVSIFVDLGFFLIVLREISYQKDLRSSLVSNSLTIKLVLGGLVFGLAFLASKFFHYDAMMQLGLALALLSQLFMSLSQAVLAIIQADLQMHKSAISDVVGRLAVLGGIWWAVSTGSSFAIVVGTAVVGNLIVFLMNWFWAAQSTRIALAFDWPVWRMLFKESLPMGIVLVLSTIYFRTGTLMLSAMKGNYEVGIYGAPYKVLEVILAFPSIFMSSVFPVLTERIKNIRNEVGLVFQKAFDVMAIVALPLIAGTLLYAVPIMLIIGGGEFVISSSALQVLIWAVGGSFLNSVMIYTLIADGHQSKLVWPYTITVIFNVVSNALLIPRYSYMGAAYTSVITEFLVLLMTGYLTYRLVGVKPGVTILLKSTLASAVMLLVLLPFRHSLIIGLSLGAVTYLGMLWILGVVNKSTLAGLIKRT